MIIRKSATYSLVTSYAGSRRARRPKGVSLATFTGLAWAGFWCAGFEAAEQDADAPVGEPAQGGLRRAQRRGTYERLRRKVVT